MRLVQASWNSNIREVTPAEKQRYGKGVETCYLMIR